MDIRGGGDIRITCHDDEMTESRQAVADRLHLGQHGLILDESHADIGMPEDVGDLIGRDIGGARHIGGTAELHGGIRKDPLEAVVGKDRDMITRSNPEFDQRCGKCQRPVTPCAVRDRRKRPVRTTGGECGEIPPPLPRFPDEGSEVR